MFIKSSCAVQRHLTMKGWQAVAAANQSYCASSSSTLAMGRNQPSLFFNNSLALRNFGGKSLSQLSNRSFEFLFIRVSVLFSVVQEVPSMGDSITEGVVESYVKSK